MHKASKSLLVRMFLWSYWIFSYTPSLDFSSFLTVTNTYFSLVFCFLCSCVYHIWPLAPVFCLFFPSTVALSLLLWSIYNSYKLRHFSPVSMAFNLYLFTKLPPSFTAFLVVLIHFIAWIYNQQLPNEHCFVFQKLRILYAALKVVTGFITPN